MSLELSRQSDGGWRLTQYGVSITVTDAGMRRISDLVRWAPCKDDDFNINELDVGYGRLLCQVCGEPGNVEPDLHAARYGHAPVVVAGEIRHVYVGGGRWGLQPETWTIADDDRDGERAR